MKRLILLLTIVPFFAKAQVGIGTSTPLASAQLEVASTTKGFLPPRMTATERNAIASPATGLIIYNTSTNSLDVYSGTVWISFGIGLGSSSTNQSLGYGVLASNTTGGENVGIGYQALNLNTSGAYNVATGYQSLKGNTTGSYNIASGFWALRSNGTGNGNVGIGYQSIYYNSGGNYNTASGYNSLYNTSGSYNVGVGYNALYINSTGSYNTAIGATAGPAFNALTNTTSIGYNASAFTSNMVQLGNSAVTNVATAGTITAGAITYPNTAGTGGYYLTTNGSNTASWAALPVTSVSAFVNAGVDVTLGNLKVRMPASGNASLQVSTVSGTYSVYGSSTKVSTGVVGASRIDGSTQVSITTTPAYLVSSDNFAAAGDTSTWLIMDTTAGVGWRISLIVGSGYNNNLITIEKIK